MNAGRKTLRPKPPDKGSFPLDHEGECKRYMVEYMQCLKQKKRDNHECREESRQYLQCRMDRGLMKVEDFSKLGFSGDGTQKQQQ
ncbi:cytochrome c oxidase assembly protein COX19-like isoform X2 [Dysidea avara]|uniref:cytochrome c oxidase assembly protein COX19-like isoform X2 n=1 Tax=Dysidea avara TaxID=196820 RepID=UPI003328E7B4